MATALKRVVTPVSVTDAFYAFSVARDAIQDALPEVGDGKSHAVSITLEPSGALRVLILVGGFPVEAASTQQKIKFMIENNMVAGYRLGRVELGFENGRNGRRTVTALLSTEETPR